MFASPLLVPQEIKKKYPLDRASEDFIKKARETIVDILSGKDPRFLLILGPCSIHDVEEAKEYASRVKELQERVGNTFFLVMRTYFEKSRTSIGWKGMLYDPFLDGSNQINLGLEISRKLLLALASEGIPAATEFLSPMAVEYFSDLISWGSIGARTVSSPIHRQLASGLPMPVGFKNTTDGNIKIAIQAMATAAISHAYMGIDEQGQVASILTKGNPHGHLVLRGGEGRPNFEAETIAYAQKLLEKRNLLPRLMVDCSHDNCLKQYDRQASVFEYSFSQILRQNVTGLSGWMLESYLEDGSQCIINPEKISYGLSITDGCMSWKSTEKLILWALKEWSEKETKINLLPEEQEPAVFSLHG